MAKWKRSGADALREYEQASSYAKNTGAAQMQQQEQTQSGTWKRSGADALREYEQSTNFPQTMRQRQYNAEERNYDAFANYRAALEQQRAQRQAMQAYQNRTKQMQEIAAAYQQAGAPQAAQSTAYQNYTRALQQQQLQQKQQRGQRLTPAEQRFMQTMVYYDPEQAAAAEKNKYKNKAVAQVEKNTAVSQQEFNRSTAMQEQYGTYQNYKQTAYNQAEVETLKGREDELDGQIKELEQQIRTRQAEAETATEEGVRRENERKEQIKRGEIESIGDMERRLEKLQEEQAQLQSTRAMKQSHMAIDPLDDETKALLREYNAGAEFYTRAYMQSQGRKDGSKMEARADLRAKGYSEDEIKSLAEYEQRLRDYENAMTQAEQSYQFGQEHPYISTAASALMAPAKALGNIESVRGVLPKGFGGYQNADMPTNIYSPLYNASRVSGNIRSGVMEDMGNVGQFLYQAGTSALDSAVNMAVSVGLVGAAGLGTGAAAQGAVANTMNWVMGSEVAADSVYEGIQNGKSNVDALIDGIVEGAIEGITEKYSVGDIIETMLSGKAAWRKVIRAFASEGAEEIASNWLNRIYDVVVKHDRGEVSAAYAKYMAQGMSEGQALAAMVKDYAQEDGLSFLAGGLSGWAMSGTYAALGKGASEANIQWTAAQAIQRGEVQDVIDLGLAQGEGEAFDRAAALQGDLMRGGEPTQKDVAGVLREYVREQRDAAEDAQSGDQTQENQTYQNFKNARQSVEQAQTEYEQAQRQQNQQRQGADLYDEDGSLLDVGEGWAEIDPEQYAGRQAEQAAAQMDAASAEVDMDYLEAQGKKQGYDDTTMAYFLNGNTTNLSTEEYAAKFQKAYERGQMGVSKEWTVGAATGMNRDVATAAWAAGRKAAQQSGAAQYSISKDYRQKLRQWNRDGKPEGASFELGTTGATLQGLGAAESDIYMNGDKIKTILKEHPEITLREVERIPEILEDPVLILKSKGENRNGQNTRLVILGSIKAENGKPILTALDLRPNENGFILDDMQKVNSAYTKKNPINFIQSSEVLFADKKRTIPLLRTMGLQLRPNELKQNGSIGSISYNKQNVNLKGVPFSEVVQTEQQGGSNGKNVSSERQERNVGARAGEQAQRVEQAAGGRSESARRGRERADQARSLSKTWSEVTNAELIGEGGSENTVRVMPRAEISKNADAKKAAEFFRTAGIKRYQFVVGQLETTVDGRTFRADGVTLADGTVLVRLDSEEYTATQLAKHEGYHIIAQRNAEMAQRIRKRLVDEGKISKAQIDSYIDAYNSIYGDNTDAYVEEIVADAYAGINRTAYGTNNIRAEVTMEAGQWTKKSGSARAPPELQFSASAEQAKNDQTETEAFKKWFGDWQNHPESASKVVNADGTPKVVYHGTGAEFWTFDLNQSGKNYGDTSEGFFFFTNKRNGYQDSALDYARESAKESGKPRIVAAYLDIRNPLRLDSNGYYTPTAYYDANASKIYDQYLNGDYDGVIIENSDKSKDDSIIYLLDNAAEIKSATDNVGTFDRNNPDIRYASAQQRFRDALPERAAEYVARTENTLVRRLADNLSVPETAKRETLRPIADEIIYDVLRGGEMDSAKLNRLFDQAWDAGREADTEYYEQYKDVREKIRTQKLFISAKDRADIADFNLFRKQTMGTLRLSSDGLPVDTFYQEMRDMAPELFPSSVTAPSDQLLQLYEVAQSIQKREKTLNEAFGAQAESFKTWARNDFEESVQRLAEGIRIAKRYKEAQERKKEKLGVPQTAEEAMELAKEVKAEKKKFQKVQSRYLLTDADQKVVNMLLRGDTTPEAVQNRENAEAILKTYEAKADYDLLALRLKAWNNTRKQGLRDQAENALNAAEAEKWVDKGSGLAYMRETMERNIRDIAKKGKVADEKAEAFNNEYFHPVHKNESDRKSYVVGLQDRIKALNLSRKVEKGNLVSESYAVQWLGEAEFNRKYLVEHPRVKQRGGFGYEEWNAAIQKFREENPKLDYAKIEHAVKEFRSIYDQLYQDMNRVRMENGYEPVDYMQGYFPHFQENDKDGSLLTRFGRHLGITDEVTPLPATINGLTQSFRPGIRYMANIQQRLGYATAYDALQGFDRYIEVASDVIYHTGDIQRLRALATQIRYRASDEGIKKRIKAILQDATLTPDEANERVAQMTKDAPFALSNFVAELDEYTNLLAGKKSRLDRGMEKMLGRKFYNVCKAFESRVGANMVAANIGSALTNFIPLTQAWSQVSSADMLHGMWQTLQNYKTADGLDAASTFIHNRSGYGRLAMSTMDKVSEKAAFLMEAVDGFTTGSVVRARYLQNLRLGMSEVNAMQEADQFAANIMADRSKGATPTIYSARNPIIKLFTQFQLEVNNELSWIFKDMIPQERKKGVAQLAKALFKFLIGAWLYNEVYEAIAGRRAALDPLDIINDSVGDFTGYQMPNTVQSALSGRWEFTKEKPGTYQAIKNLGGNLVSELPGTQMLTVLGLDEKLGLEIDSGRIAVSSAIPNFGNIEKALLASNEDIAPKKKVQTVINELANPAAYLALPFGGGQIKKMAQGAQAVVQGGSYKADNEGRDILQYPIYSDKPGEMAKNLAQALLFGKTATEEAQGWIESGFKNLSAKETAAYQEMTAYEDQRSSFDFVKAIRALDKSAAKKAFLASYTGVSERAKAAYYYNVLASDTQKAEMEPMSEQQRIDYMNEKLQESQDDMIRTNIRDGVQAGTVSEADAVRRMVAGGFAEDENDAYWKIREWKGGDDYAKYDEFLSAVDKSGDVAKAAKTYLDHGVKADALASTITKAYKQQYIAASSAERKRLKKLLLDAYAAIGYDRKEKEKDIDKWLEDDK